MSNQIVATQALGIIEGLGGEDNIVEVRNCITRLRVDLKDPSAINEWKLRTSDALSVIPKDNNELHVLIGADAQKLADSVRELLASSQKRDEALAKSDPFLTESVVKFAGSSVSLQTPVAGEAIDISNVLEDTFAQNILGPGVAVVPSTNEVVAPADAKVINVLDGGHAITLLTDSGIELLVHIGTNFEYKNKDAFNVFVSDGDTVKAGDKVLSFDLEALKGTDDLYIPIVVCNYDDFYGVKFDLGDLKIGDNLIELTALGAEASDTSFDYTITDSAGIHARPAGHIAKIAKAFTATTTVKFGDKTVSAASVFQLLALGAKAGDTITFAADGEDAGDAILALKDFAKNNL